MILLQTSLFYLFQKIRFISFVEYSNTLLPGQITKFISGEHYFDVLALAELQKETYSGFYTTVTNFNTDQFGYNNLQAGAIRLWEGTNSYFEQPRLASFLGRFNYTFADRYIFTVNTRTDASSKFGANHK